MYLHLQKNPPCQEKVNFVFFFEIIDCASSYYFRLQIKEAIHINWKKPELYSQVKHVGITISMQVYCSIIVSLFAHFIFSFSSLSVCAFCILIIYVLLIVFIKISVIKTYRYYDFNFDSHMQPCKL